MFYRVKQFLQALYPRITPVELQYVQQTVPPEALPLFLSQSVAEQRHALNVVKHLAAWKSLTSDEYLTLVLAALFHDCGKSWVGIKLWERVFIVLADQAPCWLKPTITRSHLFAHPLQIASQHADWGCDLAQASGLPPLVCYLIQEHHHPTTALGRLLQKADNLS